VSAVYRVDVRPLCLLGQAALRELREEIGLSEALIGIENVEELISDLAQGLEYV
jgi:8-oxo-dGTP pyrophosphatase MutT (NUDIX family)